MSLIAVDGYDLAEMQEKTDYILPPGGRADFLIQAPASGKYKVMKRRFQGNARDQVLSWFEVAGPPAKMTKPRGLPPPPAHFESIKDDEIKRRRTIRFQMCPDQAQGETCKGFPLAKPCSMLGPADVIKTAFLIDGQPYDPDRIDHKVELGTAEEWEIVNETGAEHPFHIHTNHFQAAVGGDWMWRDTVSLPADGKVKIRLRFVDYAGRFPLHCHILLHSDMGMMQNVEVVGSAIAESTTALAAVRNNTLIESTDGKLSNGQGPGIFVGRTGQPAGSIRRGLIAFDVSPIPAGSKIVSAKLTMNLRLSAGTGRPSLVTVHRVLAGWGEGASKSEGGRGATAESGDATWLYSLYPDQRWAHPGGDYAADESAAQTVGDVGTYEWSGAKLAADIQGWLRSPKSNFGWILLGDESQAATAKVFDSRHSSVEGAHAPQLTVTYTAC
jgi:hypothetical protein